MSTERKVLDEHAILEEINQLKRNGRSDEVLRLVEADYRYGLTKEEIDIYMDQQFSVPQMFMVSRALREHSVELAKAIANADYDNYRMQVAIDFCNRGIPVQAIAEGLSQAKNAHALKEVLKKVLEGIRIDKEKEELKQKLKEQEKLIQEQNKIIDESMKVVHQYQHDLERMDAFLKDAGTDGKALKSDATDIANEQEKPISEKLQPQPIPGVYYTVGVAANNRQMISMQLEKTDKSKQTGMYALAGKLGFKKKSRTDIVCMVSRGDLSTAQLVQIKHAIERGLTEQQLVHLVESCAPPEQMKEIIEIAVLENQLT